MLAMTWSRSIVNLAAPSRRRLRSAAASLVLVPWLISSVPAQDFPTHLVRIFAFPAGGPTDFVARLLADKLKFLLGKMSWSRTSRAPMARSARNTSRAVKPTGISCSLPRFFGRRLTSPKHPSLRS
jgi:hypothetical protein